VLESLRDETGNSDAAALSWAKRHHLVGVNAREAAADLHRHWRNNPEKGARLTLISVVESFAVFGRLKLTDAEQAVWDDFDPPRRGESLESWQWRSRELYAEFQSIRGASHVRTRRGAADGTALRNAKWFVRLRMIPGDLWAAEIARLEASPSRKKIGVHPSQVTIGVNRFAKALGEPVIRLKPGRKREVPDRRVRRSL
jgi:hypothetical protein